MGFCRRCGDIVSGPRCKCGGTSVAPAVKWEHEASKQSPDRWSRTYVTKPSTTPVRTQRTGDYVPDSTPAGPSTPSKRFPRPQSSYTPSITINSRVSAHIASATSSRPPSPLKHSFFAEDSDSPSAKAAEGILPNPSNGSELSKVYGSVLQSTESLATYHCALCSTSFPPDATVYPDPAQLSSGTTPDLRAGTRFLCRDCFIHNGGSRGSCPTCRKPVLILKSEGPFIENGGRVWHRKCFVCSGCSKDIGDTPMVDLLGRPSCVDCFDGCLTRKDNTPKKRERAARGEVSSNLGGTKRNDRDREGSPALEELEGRLGIARSREATPEVETRRWTKATSPRSPVSTSFSTPDYPRRASTARDYGSGNDSSGVPYRLKTPDLGPSLVDGSPKRAQVSDGSPRPRRSYGRLKSPEPDSPSSRPSSVGAPRTSLTGGTRTSLSGSPRFGSPSSSNPSQDAIEEMKKRFLNQASPSPSAIKRASSREASMEATPTRAPRVSITSERSPAARDDVGTEELPSIPRRGLRKSASRGSFSSLPQDEARKYFLQPDRTGDAEIESLLGTKPGGLVGDLIDLVSPTPEPAAGRRTSINIVGARTRESFGQTASLRLGMKKRPSVVDDSAMESDTQSVPPTPDLAGDFSDAASTTPSSAPSTPPSVSPSFKDSDKTIPRRSIDAFTTSSAKITSTGHGLGISNPTPLSPESRCTRCHQALFNTKNGGKFVTVPNPTAGSGQTPQTYHTACFRCSVCDGVFEERQDGRAVFVRSEEGICHVECAPPTKVKTWTVPSKIPRMPQHLSPPLPTAEISKATPPKSPVVSSRYERPPPAPSVPVATPAQTRFGGSSGCPGCGQAVSVMERGVVPGPQGSRWHQGCLICGGKEAKGKRKEAGKPGCGKKLDSAAKTDSDGKVWCRECLLLLPAAVRQSPSPSKSNPVVPSYTGGRGPFGGVAPQHTGATNIARHFTGTTTLARQHTGIGSHSDAGLVRQMTGGGLSPTRQLTSSPTKMYDGPRPGAARFPRPRSVIGTRSEGGEGRGMFLVRQLTGGSGAKRE